MTIRKESEEIYSSFDKARSSNKPVPLNKYSREALEQTLVDYWQDTKYPTYKAIQFRIEALKDDEKRNEGRREKWKDRLIGFVFGIIAAITAGLILHSLTR